MSLQFCTYLLSCTENSDRWKEGLSDDVHESVTAYLVVCGAISQNVGLRRLRNSERVRFVSIPDGVQELCEECLAWCASLPRVTFGESSYLKLIWKGFRSGVRDIHIPDGVGRLLRVPPLCRIMRLAEHGDRFA